MRKVTNQIFLEIGFWFGNLVVRSLEKIIPSFRNKKQKIYGFTDSYLKEFDQTDKGNFKGYFKVGIIISISIAFWIYFTGLLTGLSGIFDINTHILLLKATLIIFFFFLLICLYAAYKLSYKE